MDTEAAECDLDWQGELALEAETWVGTRFHHKARIKGVGVDCGGFLHCLFAPYIPGIKPFPRYYAPDWALHNDSEIYTNFIDIYFDEVNDPIRLCDVKVLQLGQAYSHGLLFLGDNRYIHAYGMQDKGSVRIDRESAIIRAYGKPVEFIKQYRLKSQWPCYSL